MFLIDILGVLELIYYCILFRIIIYHFVLLHIITYYYISFRAISYYFVRLLKVMYNLGITLRNFWYINNTYPTHFLYIRYASSCDIYNLGISRYNLYIIFRFRKCEYEFSSNTFSTYDINILFMRIKNLFNY